MAVLHSFGALQRVNDRSVSTTPTEWRASSLDVAGSSTYAAIYATQPNVRTVIDFLARNIAQVPFLIYRRVSDTDRVRLATHELALWLAKPNPDTTAFRLLETTMHDLSIYGVAYWMKVRLETRIGLVRIAPEMLAPQGWLLPTSYVWTKPDGEKLTLAPDDVVVFRYFNPQDPLVGLSPLETLRRLLAEDAASLTYRAAFWRNAARLEGVVQRPKDAPKWSTEQKQSWREQWAARYSGQPGQVAVLEDGMTFQAISHSARDSEFTMTRKLTREEVASAFHVPLPMVGILDHATFSNIREQHKHLYQDCFGPSFEMLQQEIERQLLPECDDTANVYVEANVADKLKGSFEEQATALRTSVGRPWMTPNEARARLNLPAMTDDPTADQLALPMNLSTPAENAAFGGASADVVVPIIRANWDRQRDRVEKLAPEERAAAFDRARWTRELADDLMACFQAPGVPTLRASHAAFQLAQSINADTIDLLLRREDAFSAAREAALYVEAPCH